jgi:3-oxoacyl-[acyl-carrier protein] reductase
VNCVAPGLIETAMAEAEVMERLLPMVPARRAGKPEEVAAAVSFLLRDEAAYITRQVIAVNGGMS